MKITRKKDNLIVTIPLYTRRWNPYNDMAGENPDTGPMNNIVGVIEHHEGYEETGFMFLQDMDYKGKDDQLTSWAVKTSHEPKEFRKLCEELKIDLWEV